ncbi:MAG: cyanoexosortase A [Hydrococcus sp. Prado102]|jgi:cyanoexosortase A|nr:cyanoexosortase A [Hydrococcus sp. Prado102]
MNASYINLVKPLKSSKFWLLGIAAGLVAVHLNVTFRLGDANLLSINALFWLVVSLLVWRKHNSLSLESGILSSCLGAILIAAILLKITALTGSYFIRLSPFISAVGLALLASGWKGFKQYWQELLVLFFLGVPYVLLSSLIDISAFTAQFAAFILWYLGFDVSRQGVEVTFPKGGVEVYAGCSGLEGMTHLLGLAVLYLVMFPTDWTKKVLVPIVAVSVAFIVNGVRVALMAVLAASSNLEAFEYWHTGNGSAIFSMISVLIFGLFCLFLMRQEGTVNRDTGTF